MTPEDMAALHTAAMTIPRPWSAAEIASLLASPGAFAVGDITGFALGRVIAGEAELLTLVVDPARRREGHGRRWLSAYEAEARARGATLSHLEVAATNHSAVALYESAGYARSGLRRAYYSDPAGPRIDALLYTKTLGAA